MLRVVLPILLLVLPLAGAPLAPASSHPVFQVYAAPPGALHAANAAEPDLGVSWSTGRLMFQAYQATHRAVVDTSAATATWTLRRTSAAIEDHVLFTDAASGRTWVGDVVSPCTVLSYTDDDGATWKPAGGACDGFDGASLAAGPPRVPAPPMAYPRVLYHCAAAAVARCSTSLDGGLTFGPGVNVQCQSAGGRPGGVHVGADGAAYLPFRDCGGKAGVAVSLNNGFTWTPHPIATATAPPAGFDPDVATTPNGNVWVAYPTNGWGVGVARGTSGSPTWTDFGDVAASAGVRSSAFHEMVAGDNGRAAVAYLGTTTDGNPHHPSFPGNWHLYVTWTTNNGATWSTTQVSTDVIQRGWICADGPACASGRNLMEGIDAQVDARGRIVVALADGCTGACTSGTGPSTSAYATIAHQSSGTDLIAP